jgi:hypothetical protein
VVFSGLDKFYLLIVWFLDCLDPCWMVPQCGDFIVNLLFLVDWPDFPILRLRLARIRVAEELA